MSYLAEWLTAFEAMRRTNEAVLSAYTARLAQEEWVAESTASAAGEAAVRVESAASGDARGESSSARSRTPQVAAGASALGRIAGAVRVIRWAWTQRRLLKESFATHADLPTGVIALTTGRLPLADSRSPRARLHALSRALPGASRPNRLGEAIETCEPLLVFEPCALSPLWRNRENCWKERVFIVDHVFVAILLACAPLQSLLHLWKHWQRRSGLQQTAPVTTARQLIAAILLGAAYRGLLDRAGACRAFIFHGNSFATEVLRACLIQATTCTDICEVLHGVPTPEVDEYFVRLFRSAPSGSKHSFVPTLRELPLHGVYATSPDLEPDFAVNPALNKYLLARPARGIALLDWFCQEYRRVFAAAAGPRPLIVTITGANSHEKEYVESESFAIEQAIIRYTEATLEQLGRPFALCYTPHPIPPWSSFAQLPLFNTHRVILYPDTTFTWLVADLCIALHSSALFEAAFAGARVFTPMRVDDSLYPAVLLNRLSHPDPLEKSLDALGRFLRENSSPPDDDPRLRISRRASRLWNLDSADAQRSSL